MYFISCEFIKPFFMQPHWYILFLTGLIPLLTGFVWYNPKVFGNTWMKSIGATPESLKGGNMALIFGLCYLFALMIALALMTIVIHQMHMFSIFADDPLMKDPSSESSIYSKHFFDTYGDRYRTFKHGAFHGIITAILFALPVVGTSALFERRGFKYIAVSAGYWVLTLALMGGVICQFMWK